jgi:trehalose-6-phosphate synthase
MADAIQKAVTMPETERRRRMKKMREAVSTNNIYRWAGKVISALLRFEFADTQGEADAVA